MNDIDFIRSYPEEFDAAMAKRNITGVADKILSLDQKRREVKTNIQQLQQQRNLLVKKIGAIKLAGGDYKTVAEETKRIGVRIKECEQSNLLYGQKLQSLMEALPNIPNEYAPVGDESASVEIRSYKKPRQFSFVPKPHYELGVSLGMMDFSNAAKISGSRFVMTSGMLAKLERALVNFMLDLHTKEFGYVEVNHPSLVKEDAMYGVGQLPKFDEDAFKTTDGFRLVTTSEVFLSNIVADRILDEEQLPLRFVANSACFRSEAGSAGRDTRGIIRQHQFNKVELVSITKPEESRLELELITGMAEEVLRLLELPYRVLLLSSGDMGFSAQSTYDIEVWLPAQGVYREISSCSNCGEFQARRMKARYKTTDGQKSLVHTLNGSALAVGRTIAAILENYQNSDGSVSVPSALIDYMGGVKLLSK